jgi:hypothetical protein
MTKILALIAVAGLGLCISSAEAAKKKTLKASAGTSTHRSSEPNKTGSGGMPARWESGCKTSGRC